MSHDISFHFVRFVQSTIASGTNITPSTPLKWCLTGPAEDPAKSQVLLFCQKALSIFEKHSRPGTSLDQDAFIQELQAVHSGFVADLDPCMRNIQELNFEALTSFLSGEQVYG